VVVERTVTTGRRGTLAKEECKEHASRTVLQNDKVSVRIVRLYSNNVETVSEQRQKCV
jgi:hypothetical protein